METIDESNLLKYLSNINIDYREKLNVPEEMSFGTEIEFFVNKAVEVEKVFKKINNANFFNRKFYKLTPNQTYISKDSLSKIYELKSPVLNNTSNDFNSLKKVCDTLSNVDICPSDQKGIHVHVNMSTLEEETKYLTAFLKLFSLYEHIIFRFSYGEEEEGNINYASYSREVSNMLYKFLMENSSNYDYHDMLEKLRNLLRCKAYALNFHKKDSFCKNETIEVRTFNSTFNSNIIQNDINLVLNMVNQIVTDNMDIDILDFKLREYDKGFYKKESYSKMHLGDAIEFSDLVFNDQLDKDYFLKQYVTKTKPKKKKLVI